MSLAFRGSPILSVGMELEFQLIDRESADLVNGIVPLLDVFPGSSHVKREFIQNTVEVASSPCADVAELEVDVYGLVAKLATQTSALGMSLCGAGTHPFCTRLAAITPGPRYEAMERTSGLLSHRQVTFATHVHLGVASGDEAMTLANELAPYLPMLIALSANSPFWHGLDTAFASFRQRVLTSSRTFGLPLLTNDWKSFERMFQSMRRAGAVRSINDIHWDIRPRPQLGTVEVRVMDAQTTVEDAVVLAAFVRALARFLQETRGADRFRLGPTPFWALKDNCFVASRFGIEARVVVDEDGRTADLRDLVEKTLDAIRPHAEAHGDGSRLRRLSDAVAGGLPYARQRSTYEHCGSLRDLVRELARALMLDVEKAAAR